MPTMNVRELESVAEYVCPILYVVELIISIVVAVVETVKKMM